jgi:Fe-S cluster assembly protein SufD
MSNLIAKNLATNKTSFYDEIPAELKIEGEGEQLLLIRKAVNTKIILSEGVKATFILFATEGWEGTPKMTFELAGRNSELQFLGFIVGTKGLHFNFETISRHSAPESKGHYYLRAAMFDSSAVDYKGTLVIPKGAQLSDAYLAHHTLLLSDEARARTIPALEIEADDIKAGHAATVGKVDKDLMFYLLSRGIEEKEAEQLLITGFFETQLRMIPEEETQTILREALTKTLPAYV